MTTPSTSLAQPLPAPTGATSEWSRYARFLARPLLPEDRYPAGTASRATARMLVLDLAVMLVLIAMLSMAGAFGFELPANVNNSLEPGLATIALIVLVAPIMEEFVFRSWLTGHPSIIAVVAICLLAFGAIPFAAADMEPSALRNVLLLGGPAAGLLTAPTAAYLLLKRPVPSLFSQGFPAFFWLSTAGFALVHLLNYTEGSLAILLPLVLPQFVLGTMLGYLRVHYGLIPAIALHAVHNGILFSLAILGKSVGAGG